MTTTEGSTPDPTPDSGEVGAPESEAPASDDISSLPENWQKYIRDLRNENAQRRTEVQQFKEVFSAFDEDSQRWLLNNIRLLADDSTAPIGAKKFRDMTYQMLTSVNQWEEDAPWKAAAEETAEAVQQAADAGQPLTPEQVQEMLDAKLAERDQEAYVEAEARRMIEQATALGYEQGTPLYEYLFTVYGKNLDAGLEAAHQQLVEAGLAPTPKNEDQTQPPEEESRSRRFPKTATAGGSGAANPPEGDGPITLKDAKSKALAYLNELTK